MLRSNKFSHTFLKGLNGRSSGQPIGPKNFDNPRDVVVIYRLVTIRKQPLSNGQATFNCQLQLFAHSDRLPNDASLRLHELTPRVLFRRSGCRWLWSHTRGPLLLLNPLCSYSGSWEQILLPQTFVQCSG